MLPDLKEWIDSRVRLAGLVVLVCACSLYGVSFVRFKCVRGRLDAMMPDGHAWFFSHNRFGYLVTFMRLVTGMAILGAGVAIVCGGRTWRVADRLRSDGQELLSDVRSVLRGAFSSAERVHVVALCTILLIAMGLRWAFLFQPMIYDEACTYTNFASWPLEYGLSWYQWPNNHVFHTFWVHVSADLFGNEPWVLRLPALVAGLAILPTAYVVFRGIHGRSVALIVTGLLAAACSLVRYSTCARGYTILVLAFVLCLGLGHYAVIRRNWFAGVVGAVVAAVGFYTIPLMAFPFGTVVIWLAGVSLQDNSRRAIRENLAGIALCSVLTVVITTLLYIPVFVESGVKAVTHNPFVAPLPWGGFWGALPSVVPDLWEHCNEGLPTLLRIILLVGFVAGVSTNWRLGAGLVVSALMCSLGLMMVQRVVPGNRMWIWALPVYHFVAAAGVWRLVQLFLRTAEVRTGVPVLLGVGLCLATAAQLVTQNPDHRLWDSEPGTLTDAAEITKFMKEECGSESPIVVGHPECVPLAYYFNKSGLPTTYFRSYEENIGKILKRTDARQILVVVGPTSTLEGTLREAGIERGRFGKATIVRRFTTASVVALSRPTP